jgi:hypothetical protein
MPQVDSVQDRGQVFLPLSLNGSYPHYFLLDTGAGVSAIDEKVARHLDLPEVGKVELAGTAGILQVSQVRIARLTPLRRVRPVDELAWYGLTPTRQDLSAFEVPMPETPEAGLLGNDFLQSFVVEIDFLPPSVQISRATGFPPAGVDPERFLPFRLDANTIVRVKATLDGWMEVDLRVDTGSRDQSVPEPYLNITTAMWDLLRERNSRHALHDTLTAIGVGGPVHLNVGRISSLEVGPLRFENPSVVIQPRQGYFARSDAVGFIALNLFQPLGWVTFDYPAGKLYLGPGR